MSLGERLQQQSVIVFDGFLVSCGETYLRLCLQKNKLMLGMKIVNSASLGQRHIGLRVTD